MKKLFRASFEQVEPSISQSFVENSIDTAKSFRGAKVALFSLCSAYVYILS